MRAGPGAPQVVRFPLGEKRQLTPVEDDAHLVSPAPELPIGEIEVEDGPVGAGRWIGRTLQLEMLPGTSHGENVSEDRSPGVGPGGLLGRLARLSLEAVPDPEAHHGEGMARLHHLVPGPAEDGAEQMRSAVQAFQRDRLRDIVDPHRRRVVDDQVRVRHGPARLQRPERVARYAQRDVHRLVRRDLRQVPRRDERDPRLGKRPTIALLAWVVLDPDWLRPRGLAGALNPLPLYRPRTRKRNNFFFSLRRSVPRVGDDEGCNKYRPKGHQGFFSARSRSRRAWRWARRMARRVLASAARRSSSSSSRMSGGTTTDLPFSSWATKVRNALHACRRCPLMGSSLSMRTPASIEVRKTAFTCARNSTIIPTLIGRRKCRSSIDAVTTRLRQWRWQAMAAAMSIHWAIFPPKAVPNGFPSPGSTVSVITTREARGVFSELIGSPRNAAARATFPTGRRAGPKARADRPRRAGPACGPRAGRRRRRRARSRSRGSRRGVARPGGRRPPPSPSRACGPARGCPV